MTLIYILIITFISSLLSLVGSFFLSRKKIWPKKLLLQLTAFSSGVLLATAFLHLAPEAAEALSSTSVFTTMFIAIVIFFLMEKSILWHHHHEDDHDCGPKPSAFFITFGDSLHNFIDGILITGAFLVDPKLGILTAFAVAAHEIPQEIADFSIMVAGGMKRKQALFLNVVSSFFSIFGAVIAFFFINSIEWLIPYVIAFSAGMFLYIALSDLIPELHSHDLGEKQKWNQIGLFFVGILIISGIMFLSKDSHGHTTDDDHGNETEHMDEQVKDNDHEQVLYLEE
jgi:zinc and cadmium transporter